MAAFGIESQKSELFVIEYSNTKIVEWFLRLQRRWVINFNDGSLLRFDDQAIDSLMNLHGVKRSDRKKIINGLSVMESAVLEYQAKKRKEE